MKIAITAKLQDGALKKKLQEAGWSASELSRRTKIWPSVIGEILNLQRKPTEYLANKIQTAFGEVGIYFDVLANWPEAFGGFKNSIKIEAEAEISEQRLLELKRPVMAMLNSPIPPDEQIIQLENESGEWAAGEYLECLNQLELKVLQLRSQGEAGYAIDKELGLCRGMALRHQKSAIRKIRNYIGQKAAGVLPSQIGVPFEYARKHSESEMNRKIIAESVARQNEKRQPTPKQEALL